MEYPSHPENQSVRIDLESSEESKQLQIVPNDYNVVEILESVPESILALHSKEKLAKILEEISFTYAYRICGHFSIDKENVLKCCTLKAGQHTNHENQGKCYLHDNPGTILSSPYTKHLKGLGSLQESFSDFEARQSEMKQIYQEMALARAILSEYLSQLKVGKTGKNDELFKNIFYYIDLLRKMAETISKINTNVAQSITLDSITAFLWSVQKIIEDEVLDQTVRCRIFDKIANQASFVIPK